MPEFTFHGVFSFSDLQEHNVGIQKVAVAVGGKFVLIFMIIPSPVGPIAAYIILLLCLCFILTYPIEAGDTERKGLVSFHGRIGV